jgi:hypothetical protein
VFFLNQDQMICARELTELGWYVKVQQGETKVKTLVVAAVIALAATPALARPAALINAPLTPDHPLTGEQLYQVCIGNPDGQGLCVTYVMGIAEGLIVASDQQFCPPGNVTYDGMARAVTEALKQSKFRTGSAARAVSGILTGVFPCKK